MTPGACYHIYRLRRPPTACDCACRSPIAYSPETAYINKKCTHTFRRTECFAHRDLSRSRDSAHMHASLPPPPSRACRRLTDTCRHLAPRLRARSLPTTAEPAGRHLCRGARPTPRPNQSARTHSTDLRPAPLSTTLQHPSLTVRPDTPLRRRGATPPTGRYAAY